MKHFRTAVHGQTTAHQQRLNADRGECQPHRPPADVRQSKARLAQMRALRGSADALGERDDDPFRPPNVGHPPSALVLADATDQSVALGSCPIDSSHQFRLLFGLWRNRDGTGGLGTMVSPTAVTSWSSSASVSRHLTARRPRRAVANSESWKQLDHSVRQAETSTIE